MGQTSLHTLIEALPKAELHVHIEGTFEPGLMLQIAARNNLLTSLPFKDLAAAKLAYQFTNLQSFLDIYYAGCAVLVTEKDFYDLTWAYLERAAADNVKYVEIMFDPQSHTVRGVAFDTVLNGIEGALKDAGPKLDIHGSLMLSFLRHLGGEEASKLLKQAEPYKQRLMSVGLDSSEVGFPPSLFQETYKAAASQGYRLSAHAAFPSCTGDTGEEAGPDYIREALDLLNVERIDHGVHCIEDDELVKVLKDRQIALTVCPLSNLKLKVYNGDLVDKLKILLRQGLAITINADDPAYFGGYENDNYKWLADNCGMTSEDIFKCCCNGFKAAFIPETKKAEYLAGALSVYEQHK